MISDGIKWAGDKPVAITAHGIGPRVIESLEASGVENIPAMGPALVVANWGGLGLHLRGTIQGFIGIASKDKWLKVQNGPYFATFFAPESVEFQRRFFDRFLKGMDNGWEKEPRVDLTVRSADDELPSVLLEIGGH